MEQARGFHRAIGGGGLCREREGKREKGYLLLLWGWRARMAHHFTVAD